jgi:hypothetical protein
MSCTRSLEVSIAVKCLKCVSTRRSFQSDNMQREVQRNARCMTALHVHFLYFTAYSVPGFKQLFPFPSQSCSARITLALSDDSDGDPDILQFLNAISSTPSNPSSISHRPLSNFEQIGPVEAKGAAAAEAEKKLHYFSLRLTSSRVLHTDPSLAALRASSRSSVSAAWSPKSSWYLNSNR